jgi:uncharacterized protein
VRQRRVFLILLGILALLHAYIGWRLLPDLPIGTAGRVTGAVLLALSFIAMPLGLVSRTLEPRIWADRIAAIGLFTMGLFSSLFVFTLLRDVVLLIALFLVPPSRAPLLLTGSAVLAASMALFATLIGLVNARRRARIVTVDIPLPNLPPALHGFTIAQITDIHVGATIKRPYVDAIVDAVNSLNADLIAVTGDVVDGSLQDLRAHTEPLGRLKARHGAYFVTGNHEYYSGERAWTE